MSNIRFGDARSRQSKIQSRRTAQSGTGRRRGDVSIHATSRPWHTSTPGIRMNVSTLGQIASRDPIAAKYLNRMNLSEQAQKKRGIAESDQGRGYDKMGKAIKRGTQASVAGRKAYGAPNQDTIDKWEAEISGRVKKAKGDVGTAGTVAYAEAELLGARQGALGGAGVGRGGGRGAARRGNIRTAQQRLDRATAQNGYERQIDHIRGLKKKKAAFGHHNIYRR